MNFFNLCNVNSNVIRSNISDVKRHLKKKKKRRSNIIEPNDLYYGFWEIHDMVAYFGRDTLPFSRKTEYKLCCALSR